MPRQLIVIHLGHEGLGNVFPSRQIWSRVINNSLCCGPALDLERIGRLRMDLADARVRPVGLDCLVRLLPIGCLKRAYVDIVELRFSLQIAARCKLSNRSQLASLLLDGCVF